MERAAATNRRLLDRPLRVVGSDRRGASALRVERLP
jgi:hypothetical protein